MLAPDLHALQQVDDPHDRPYPQIGETIWEGLALLPYMVLPHYKSDHPESADIDLEVQYCIDNKTPFVALRDGEVLVLDISAEVSEIPLRPCPCCAEIPAGT